MRALIFCLKRRSEGWGQPLIYVYYTAASAQIAHYSTGPVDRVGRSDMPRGDLRLWFFVWSLLVYVVFSRPVCYDLAWLGLVSARGTDICCRLSRWLLPNAFEVSHDFCIDSRKEESWS